MIFGKLLPIKRAVGEPDFAAEVADYNDRLAHVAVELTTPSSPIIVADTASKFVADDHTWDGVHPNARGELRVAAAFADAMSAAFGMGASYPRPLPDVPLGPQQPPVASVTSTGPTTAELSWTPSVGATWVWTKDNVINKEWKKPPIPLTQKYNPWHITNIVAGNTYYYKLEAAKGDDAGAISDEVALPVGGLAPIAADGLTAIAGDGKAVLNWTANQNATGYKVIMRNTTAGQAFQELPYAVEGTAWPAPMLQNGATYEFKLKSVNGPIEFSGPLAVAVGCGTSLCDSGTMSASDPQSSLTSTENRFSAWQVAVVFMAAALVSFVASLEEIRQVGQVWLDCEMDSAGMGGYLMMFHLPVLFFGQTALLGAVATVAMSVIRPRYAAVLIAVTAGMVLLVLFAFVYFNVNDFPVTNQFCRTPQPTWWP